MKSYSREDGNVFFEQKKSDNDNVKKISSKIEKNWSANGT
jgi:hypothetical protein